MSLPNLLSIRKAAEVLGLSPWTIRKHIQRGTLPCVRIGGRVLIEPAELERLIERGRSGGRL
jgi:excisionase family DNA binding protein